MPLKTPGGRVYVFYTYNKDNLREVAGSNSRGTARRVDTLGAYCFKFSDDNGRATNMKLYDPGHLTVDNQGLLHITDYFNHRVWAVRYRNQ